MTQGHRFWKIQRPDCFANSFYPILFIYFHGQHSAQSQEKMELLLLMHAERSAIGNKSMPCFLHSGFASSCSAGPAHLPLVCKLSSFQI